MTNKTHIAIDGNEANIISRVGSNVFAFEIISHLEKILQNNENVEVTVLLSSEKISALPKERIGWHYKVITPRPFWTQWALPIHLFINQKKYDIFFTPGHYAPKLCPIPYISSILDTAYLEYPKQFKKSDTFKLTQWTEFSVKNAKKVITISKFTKNEIIKHYKKNPDDIIVAYPDASIEKIRVMQKNVNSLFRKYNISQPYFLFVGTIQPRKNISALVEAFEIYYRMNAGRSLQKKQSTKNKTNKKPKLILAGKIGWLSEPILTRIQKSPIKNRIITTGFVSNIEKQILYQNATATCLVGLYEGFGIPPLESLHFNTIPIVSNTTSLPEVVGEAGFLVNPSSPQDIANKMWQAQNISSIDRRIFKKKAKEQIKKFNWVKSSESILTTILNTCREVKNEKQE